MTPVPIQPTRVRPGSAFVTVIVDSPPLRMMNEDENREAQGFSSFIIPHSSFIIPLHAPCSPFLAAGR
jgi:hypothetical protein